MVVRLSPRRCSISNVVCGGLGCNVKGWCDTPVADSRRLKPPLLVDGVWRRQLIIRRLVLRSIFSESPQDWAIRALFAEVVRRPLIDWDLPLPCTVPGRLYNGAWYELVSREVWLRWETERKCSELFQAVDCQTGWWNEEKSSSQASRPPSQFYRFCQASWLILRHSYGHSFHIQYSGDKLNKVISLAL